MSEYEHTEHLLEEIDQLRTTNRQIREYAEEQNQRIKRLEEAGDALCIAALYTGWVEKVEAWAKAKEDKP